MFCTHALIDDDNCQVAITSSSFATRSRDLMINDDNAFKTKMASRNHTLCENCNETLHFAILSMGFGFDIPE